MAWTDFFPDYRDFDLGGALDEFQDVTDELFTWGGAHTETFNPPTNAGEPSISRTIAGATTPANQRSEATTDLRGFLTSSGIDPDAELTQVVLSQVGDTDQQRLEFFQRDEAGRAMLTGLATNPDAQLPFMRSDYAAALGEAGFARGEVQNTSTQFRPGMAMFQAKSAKKTPEYEYNDQTGWTMFANGVLVSPNGEIAFDPARPAPGSLPWRREIQSTWTEEEVAKWKARLKDYGYLSKDEAKVRGFNTPFLDALTAYHYDRYTNGGTPIAASGDGASGSTEPKQPLFDYSTISNQISNSVHDQLRSMYGTEPDEAEIKRWTQFVIRHGMELQRQYRSEDVSSYAELGKQEALETMVARTRRETAPFRENLEENTELRDALARAAAVASGLA